MPSFGTSMKLLQFFFGVVLVVFMATSIADQAVAQSGSLSVTILADSAERPLIGAEARLERLNVTARSDSSGRVRFLGIPVGQHRLSIRHIGYEPMVLLVNVEKEAPLELDVLLQQTITQLSKVEVSANKQSIWSGRLIEFEGRRKAGMGRFLSSEVFALNDGRRVSDILRGRMPGVRTRCVNSKCFLYSTRGQTFQGPSNCYVGVVLNGLFRYSGREDEPFFDIDQLNAADILAVEYYTVANTPSQFNITGVSCGLIVIWTK